MHILIISPICSQAIEKLRARHEVICSFNPSQDRLKSVIHDREVLIFRSGVVISSAVTDCAPNLKLLIRAGSGIDNLELNSENNRALKLERIPEPGAKAVAEMSFALMLALARNLLQADHLIRQGHWAKYELTGTLLTGKILGIIGVGNIGSRVGQLGAAWGMKVIGCVKNPSQARAAELAAKKIRLTDCSEVVATADFLSIHVPLSESTRKLINEDVLCCMKPGSYLINLSRGGVVDEQALYKALTNGDKLLGAAMDVHQVEGEGNISPLAALPNVILTPHMGAQTVDSQREIGERVLEIIDSFEADMLNSKTNKTKINSKVDRIIRTSS